MREGRVQNEKTAHIGRPLLDSGPERSRRNTRQHSPLPGHPRPMRAGIERRCRLEVIDLLPEGRVRRAVDEKGFKADIAGKSITALEIEYGVLTCAEQGSRSHFFFRWAVRGAWSGRSVPAPGRAQGPHRGEAARSHAPLPGAMGCGRTRVTGLSSSKWLPGTPWAARRLPGSLSGWPVRRFTRARRPVTSTARPSRSHSPPNEASEIVLEPVDKRLLDPTALLPEEGLGQASGVVSLLKPGAEEGVELASGFRTSRSDRPGARGARSGSCGRRPDQASAISRQARKARTSAAQSQAQGSCQASSNLAAAARYPPSSPRKETMAACLIDHG